MNHPMVPHIDAHMRNSFYISHGSLEKHQVTGPCILCADLAAQVK